MLSVKQLAQCTTLVTLGIAHTCHHMLYFAEAQGPEHVWRVPGVAHTNLDGHLAPKQPARLPAKLASTHQRSRSKRRSTAPAKATRRELAQAQSRDSSQERAEHRAAERAAKKAAQVEALEREWRVQQVAGELGRQADLLERHRYLVAKYGASEAIPQRHQPVSLPHQVMLLLMVPACTQTRSAIVCNFFRMCKDKTRLGCSWLTDIANMHAVWTKCSP